MTVLNHLDAMKQDGCGFSFEWFGSREIETAWEDCERGDWMLKLCAKLDIDNRLLVSTCFDCVEPVLQRIPLNDYWLNAVAITEAWIKNKATIEQIKESIYLVFTPDHIRYTISASYDAVYASYAINMIAAQTAKFEIEKEKKYSAEEDMAWDKGHLDSFKHSAELIRKRIPLKMIKALFKNNKDNSNKIIGDLDELY